MSDPGLLRRADSAPAEIAPGLLGATLDRAGGWGSSSTGSRCRDCGSLIAGASPGRRPPDRDREAARRRKNRGSWRSGSPAAGFDGNLTSDSTRLDGYVLSTDIAPTILDDSGRGARRDGGEPIRSEGEVDPARSSTRGADGGDPERRGPVIGWSLLAWVVAGAAPP